MQEIVILLLHVENLIYTPLNYLDWSPVLENIGLVLLLEGHLRKKNKTNISQ